MASSVSVLVPMASGTLATAPPNSFLRSHVADRQLLYRKNLPGALEIHKRLN
jgi:hypothetical protein